MSSLEIKDLQIKHGMKLALENIDLTFETGHCYALLGQNGAGKSSLIRELFKKPKRGSIMIDGVRVYNNQEQMSKIYCMSQVSFFPKELKLTDIMKLLGSAFPAFDSEFAKGVMQKADVDLKQKFGKLSVGTSTLFRAVMALATNADFIFLDEPELGVDIKNRELFLSLFAKRMTESDSCFVIATHNLQEFENLPDKIIILQDHTVALFGDSEEISKNYVMLSGKKELFKQIREKTMNKKELGSFMSVVVKVEDRDAFLSRIPEGVEISNCSLQDIFLAITSKEGVE